jgi:hypothetical protein
MLLSPFIQDCKKGNEPESDPAPCSNNKQDIGPMILSVSPANGALVGTTTTFS